jgi:hypothetical protein
MQLDLTLFSCRLKDSRINTTGCIVQMDEIVCPIGQYGRNGLVHLSATMSLVEVERVRGGARLRRAVLPERQSVRK